jgi:hypothetical protein
VTRILSAASAAWAGYVPRRTSDRRALAAFVAGVLFACVLLPPDHARQPEALDAEPAWAARVRIYPDGTRVYESARLEDWPAVLATINAAEEQ